MSRTIILSLRVMNGFRLDDNFVPQEIDDDLYSFTFTEGNDGPSQDEVLGNKALIVSLLRQFADRLESPDWKEVKYQYSAQVSNADDVMKKQTS